ncbi:MAG: ABC transporter ATP-binding protein [Lachnospiraceae bacterium]|nr:ABC transporter ATP-binding protein [Lachnospiraceae bacterium]
MSYLIESNHLCKKFGNKQALADINLRIERGRIIGLLGPNGSGKSTLIKIINGLMMPTEGEVFIDEKKPGVETKKIISYLPERTYLNEWMKVKELLDYFEDFYEDFRRERAITMLENLNIGLDDKLKTMSKGTKEKVQLILVMSRDADLYILDEPIGGVDPAARDYILRTIIGNYNENATVLLSTHLISDIENILDEVIFLQYGQIRFHASVDEIRMKEGKSVDQLFREVYRC